METRVSPSAISVILLLMAATSLLIMLSLNQINYMIHRELYNFGLQFSYRWAMPYWILSGIVFGLSWTNIVLSIVFTLYVQKKSRRKAEPLAPIQERVEVPKTEEKEQRTISEFIVAPQDASLKNEAPRENPLAEIAESATEAVEVISKRETQTESHEAAQTGQAEDAPKIHVEEESGQGQSVL